MPFIQTPRGRFFYRQAAGEGDAPTVLFLHGNLGSSRWWRPTLNRLPAGWRGLAPDAIGYGYSDATDRCDRFSISAQVQDVAAFVAALELGRVHLAAHSSATPVAIEYALAYPRQTATLTLVGPVPAAGVTTPPEAYPLLERISQEPELLAQALHASMPALPTDSPQFRALFEDAGLISPSAFVAVARGLDAWRGGDRLRQLTLPVLLVRGEYDVMLSKEEAQQTLLAIPGANNLEVFRGVGHSPMLENPQAFAEALAGFIAEDWEGYSAVRDSA